MCKVDESSPALCNFIAKPAFYSSAATGKSFFFGATFRLVILFYKDKLKI